MPSPGGRFWRWRGASSRLTGTNGSVGTVAAYSGRAALLGPQQAEMSGVEQGLPRRLDEVLVDADRGPRAVLVGRVDQHARDRARALVGVEDAHLVVGEVQAAQRGQRTPERLAERGVE